MTGLWCQRLDLPDFQFMHMMSSETERLEWKAQVPSRKILSVDKQVE